jgi:hypothetical protein
MEPVNNIQPTGADVQILINQYPEVGKILESIMLSRVNAENAHRVEADVEKAAGRSKK